jgi:hypothetical protein
MEAGRGYSVEGTSTGVQTITFSGIPFNGLITKSLYYSGTPDTGNDNENFNLIGNPYPTAIDIDKFLFGNGNISDIALWSHATPVDDDGNFTPADYLKYSLSGPNSPGVTKNIGSGQGFMARSISQGGATFVNDYKMEDANDQFYKTEVSKQGYLLVDGNRDRIWVRLKDDSNIKDDILVAFDVNTTDDFDQRYDTPIGLGDKSVKLFSQINDNEFVIQSLGQFSEDKKVSLGFETKKEGKFKLSISGLEGNLKDAEVYLVDHLLGVTHNLKDGPYNFEQRSAGEFKNRFTLQFAAAALGTDDFIKDNDFSIASVSEGFNINASKVVNKIRVYDMLGRLVLQQKPNKQSFNVQTFNVKQGTVLIFEVTLENGAILNKKTIKY